MELSPLCLLLADSTPEHWGWKLATIVVPSVTAILSVWLGLKIWHKQKQSEPGYQSREYLNRRKLDGLLAGWSLLGYLSETESARSIMVWVKNGKEITYYLRPPQIREYLDNLNSWFYTDGYGLLYDKRIKELFFEARSIYYGFLLKEGVLYEGQERIKVDRIEMIERLKELYQQINNELYDEMRNIYD